MDLFWQKGYEATSMRELVERTGVHRGSLYRTFGNKRELFLAAMEHWYGYFGGPRLRLLKEAESGLKGVKAVMRGLADDYVSGKIPNGCMIANTAAEMPPRDKKIRNLVQVMLKAREEAIFTALVRAQEEGELSPRKNARHLAQYLNTFLLGVGILARTSPDPRIIKTVVNESLQLLD